MSGIFAVYYPDGTSPSEENIKRCMNEMRYRGRNGNSFVINKNIAIGHLEFGASNRVRTPQPIESDSLIASFDGRIDNRSELASLLSLRGISRISDAELFVKMYHEYGRKFLNHIIGVFGFVIWDKDEKRLFFGRDRTGVRSIYHKATDDVVVVASDAHAITKHQRVSRKVNEDLLHQYLRGEGTHSNETFYEDVLSVNFGEYVEIRRSGIDSTSYWFPTEPTTDANESNPARKLRSALTEAIRCRTRDVDESAVLMSGGVDSPAIPSLTRKRKSARFGPDEAFSLVFEEVGDDIANEQEKERIDRVANDCDLPVTKIWVTDYPSAQKVSPSTPLVSESPCVNPFSTYLTRTFQEASQSSTEIFLSGDGADLHNGNPFCYADVLSNGEIVEYLTNVARDPLPTKKLITSTVMGMFAKGMIFEEYAAVDSRIERFDHVSVQATYAQFFNLFRSHARHSDYRSALWSGIKLRFPYLDVRVVEAALNGEPEYRYQHGDTKKHLRNALDGYLLDSSRLQSNSNSYSFTPHLQGMIRRIQESGIFEKPDESILVREGYLSSDRLQGLLSTDPAESYERCLEMWRVVSAERWLNFVKRGER